MSRHLRISIAWIAVLAVGGCATTHKRPENRPTPAFFTVSWVIGRYCSLTFDDDRTVWLLSEQKYLAAKLTPEEFTSLSSLVENANLGTQLATYRSNSLVVVDSLVVERGPDRWVIPGDRVGELPVEVVTVLGLSDRIGRKYFGLAFNND